MNSEWSIQSRGNACAVSGKHFEDGESFYTLLFEEKLGFRREDVSEAAFKERPTEAPQPFSFWRSKYQVPEAGPPEALEKQTAEDLLRRYMADGHGQYANARYILALMLERKRLLREVDTKRDEQGELVRIYEHVKTGEVFLIPDPQLRLDQIAAVQTEVAGQLGG
jgi:hypothetical protein